MNNVWPKKLTRKEILDTINKIEDLEVNKDNKPWHVKYVAPETRKRFKKYALDNDLSMAEVLDIASRLLK